MASQRQRLHVYQREGVTTLDLGPIEIWDGRDMTLLRESMARLVNEQHCRSLGINLRYVKYLPSGFFGLLMDWYDQGIHIYLYDPQPHVQNMVWFRQFVHPVGGSCYLVYEESDRDPSLPMLEQVVDPAQLTSQWQEETGPMVVAPAQSGKPVSSY